MQDDSQNESVEKDKSSDVSLQKFNKYCIFDMPVCNSDLFHYILVKRKGIVHLSQDHLIVQGIIDFIDFVAFILLHDLQKTFTKS